MFYQRIRYLAGGLSGVLMRLRVVGTAASLLATVPGVSLALGLGDIQLKSTLNSPLNAEIELIATPEELASLKATIASRETFTRYGLDYPAFLSGVVVRPVRLTDGRNVIQLTSSAPMTEPFATVLVEASWARGRNLREYTVLFDPPVFAPGGNAAAPVAAPVAGAGERSGAISRPVPAPEPAAATPSPAAPAASRPAPAAAAGGSYSVRGGDSLSGIAQRQYPAGQTDQAMIAIYRNNPQAFDGNINVLRAGSILRLPDQSAVAAVDAGEAAGEVRRQVAAWSGSSRAAGSGESADARLRLVPPGGGGAGGNAAESQLRDRVTQLESELAESRRLLELRNAELARLQSAANTKPPVAAPAPTPPAAEPAPVTPPVAAEPPPAAQPAPAAAEPVPAPAPKAAVPAESGPGLIDKLKAFWFIPVGLLLLLIGALAMRAVRSRRQSSMDNLAPFAVTRGAGSERDPSSDTFPLRKPVLDRDDPIVVEESGTHQRPSFARKDTRTVDLDEGTASMVVPALDATAALEQGDPLAEADFHMAYGLYDQAADLVKQAIQREPNRRDVKLKLLEVFFVWGNKDQFLQTARDLADTREEAAPGEWEKVVIMGKQLAPEDALFSQTYSGAGPTSVDLNLEGGQNLIDFDLHGEPSVSSGGIDMDLGSGTQDVFVSSPLDGGLDFMLDDPARGGDDLARTATTRQMAQPGFGEEDGTSRMSVDGPTVEQPQLDVGSTVVGKLGAQQQFGLPDQTAELALDDLGLDLGKLESTNDTMLDDSRLTQALSAPDAPTLVAGLDETSRRLIEGLSDPNQPTELLPLADLVGDSGDTSQVSVLDFDLDSDAETGKRAALTDTDFSLDLDVGSADQLLEGEHQRTQRIEPPGHEFNGDATESDLEPVTMSEVGTKLDLARAYIDMGDPDGAKSILEEVIGEGSPQQKQEAQELLKHVS
jgi:pilus assembly protein FimV